MDLLAGVVVPVVSDLDTEVLSLVALLPVVEPPLRRVVVVAVLLPVAVEAGARRDRRSLTAVGLVIAEVTRADADRGVVVTGPVVTVTEPHITARTTVLDIEVVVPTTPVLVLLLLIGHPHTQGLLVTTDLLVVQAGDRLVLLDAVVAHVTPLGCGGRERHGSGPDGVIQTVIEPVVTVVSVVTETGRGVLIAGPLDTVLTDDAAVLAVHPVLPVRVPASLHLQRLLAVVGMQREAEREVVVLAVHLLEV